MKINWEPEGWNQSQKDELLSFWAQRYAQNPVQMSPQANHRVGGTELGLFDSVQVLNRLKETHPGQAFKQKAYLAELKINRIRDLDNVYTSKAGADHDRIKMLKKTENSSYAYASNPSEENRQGFQKAMGNLISHDAALNHPIANPDRDLKQNPPTVDERINWLSRDGYREQPTAWGGISERQQLENMRTEEGHYKNGLFFSKEAPEVANRGEFIPMALENKVAQEQQREAQQKQEPKPMQDPAQVDKASSTPTVEHKAIEAKDYFMQRAPDLEELGKKLDREATPKEQEGKGQMQEVQKAFTQKEVEGRADFSPKAEHDSWAKKIEMADRANTERQAQMKNEQSPKLRTQEELKTPAMAEEKTRLEGFQEKALGKYMENAKPAEKPQAQAQDPNEPLKTAPQMKSLEEVGSQAAANREVDGRSPPQMKPAERTEKLQAQAQDPYEPMKTAPQMKSLEEVGTRTASSREAENRLPPQMNAAKAEEKKPEGQTQDVMKTAPQMNSAKPAEQVKAQETTEKAPPSMNVHQQPPVEVPRPVRERGGYSR